jgi:hypothetical protein
MSADISASGMPDTLTKGANGTANIASNTVTRSASKTVVAGRDNHRPCANAGFAKRRLSSSAVTPFSRAAKLKFVPTSVAGKEGSNG